MANGPSLLDTEQRLFDDTNGGRDGSTELAGSYMRIASETFQQAIQGIHPDEDLVAAKTEQGGNNQGGN